MRHSKTIHLALWLALFFCALEIAGQAQERRRERTASTAPAASPAPSGYTAFRMVRLKNIFDPDRRAIPPEGTPKPSTVAPPRVPFLVLTGTMVTDKKRLAFFSGSQSDYNRVISVNERLGDVQVTEIASSHVDLKRGDLAYVLPVGKQLTLGTPATIGSPINTPEPATANSAPAASSTAPAESTGAPAAAASQTPAKAGPPAAGTGAPVDRAEMIRRMMERRQKETK